MKLPKLMRHVRDILDGLWFVPLSLTLLGLVLGELLPWLDRTLAQRGQPLEGAGGFIYHFQASPDSARGLLVAAAGALATIVSVSFSITTVTVQLASTQFTPRLLRNFMGDRVTQSVLGSFLGTVAYLFLVLRSVKDPLDDTVDGFVPLFSLLAALLFTVACLLLLPLFLHHVASSIQATTIASHAASRTLSALGHLELRATPGIEGLIPEGPSAQVRSDRAGYLQVVDERQLCECLPRGCRVARVEPSVGDFVLPGMVLVSLWPPRPLDEEAQRRVRGAFALGQERMLSQDVRLGVRQLVDMGLKALSPGINDVTTAMMTLNELGAMGLRLACEGVEPEAGWREVRGPQGEGPRLLMPVMGMKDFLQDAFDEIASAARSHPRVLARILELLTQMGALSGRPELRRLMLETGRKVHALAEGSLHETMFRDEVEARWNRLRTATLDPEQHPPHPPFIQ